MKNKLIIPVLLLMAFPVRAQFSSMQADAVSTFPSAKDCSIIRVYNDQYVVGYIEDVSGNFIYMSEIEGFDHPGLPCLSNAKRVECPAGIRINDLYCIEDQIYFCGVLYVNGLYGWINLHELAEGASVNFNISHSPNFSLIRKLVVPYPHLTEPIIIAVGESKATFTGVATDCILMVQHNILYLAAALPIWGSSLTNQVDDLLLYGDTIIVVGSDKSSVSSNDAFYVRLSDWTDLLSWSGLGVLFAYQYSTPIFSPEQGTASVILDSNILAVAHGCTVQPAHHLALIDLGTMTCTSVQACANLRTPRMVSLEYLPHQQQVVLNYRLFDNSTASAFLPFCPFKTYPYTSTHFYMSSPYFTSTARLGDNSVIATSRNRWGVQRYFSTYSATSCRESQPVNIVISPNYSVTSETTGVDMLNPYFMQYNASEPVSEFPINIDCLY